MLRRLRSPARRLADRYPRLRPLIRRGWNTVDQLRFRFYSWRNTRQHVTEAAHVEPHRLHNIPPRLIEYHSRGGFDPLSDVGRVVDGNWDLERGDPIEGKVRYVSFRDRFYKGVSWDDTELYRQKVEWIESDRQSKFESVDALNRKCAELDRLYEEIRTEGYRTQEELDRTGGSFGAIVGDGGRGLIPFSSTDLVRSEIAVDIARDGEPMLNEGRHRMCIAKLLDLESVPVRVVVRHRQWQGLRNEVVRLLQRETFDSRLAAFEAIETQVLTNENVVMGVDHPDLRAIVDEYIDGEATEG